MVVTDGVLRGFELPDIDSIVKRGVSHEFRWHPQTIEWWNHWRASPLSQNWIATDWDFLLDTALMHSTMWTTGDFNLAAEVRLRVAKHGATYEDRLRLKVSVDAPIAGAQKQSVALMNDYREAAAG